jgi:hypothetical protein
MKLCRGLFCSQNNNTYLIRKKSKILPLKKVGVKGLNGAGVGTFLPVKPRTHFKSIETLCVFLKVVDMGGRVTV